MVGMLLALNCYICRHRSRKQQRSHLGVINPYSPTAAFLPFTTYCLELKRRAEGKTLKLQSCKKSKIGREEKIRWYEFTVRWKQI